MTRTKLLLNEDAAVLPMVAEPRELGGRLGSLVVEVSDGGLRVGMVVVAPE